MSFSTFHNSMKLVYHVDSEATSFHSICIKLLIQGSKSSTCRVSHSSWCPLFNPQSTWRTCLLLFPSNSSDISRSVELFFTVPSSNKPSTPSDLDVLAAWNRSRGGLQEDTMSALTGSFWSCLWGPWGTQCVQLPLTDDSSKSAARSWLGKHCSPVADTLQCWQSLVPPEIFCVSPR